MDNTPPLGQTAAPTLDAVCGLAVDVRRMLARARERLAQQIAAKARELPGAPPQRLGALAEAVAELEGQDEHLRRVAVETQRMEDALHHAAWAREPDKLLLIEAILVRARAAAAEPLRQSPGAAAEITDLEYQIQSAPPEGPSQREVATMMAEQSEKIENFLRQLAEAPPERFDVLQLQLMELKRIRSLTRTVCQEIGSLQASAMGTGPLLPGAPLRLNLAEPALRAKLEAFKARVREFRWALPEHMATLVAEIIQLRYEMHYSQPNAPSLRPLAPLRERLDRGMQAVLGAAMALPAGKAALLVVQAREIQHLRDQLAEADHSVARVQLYLQKSKVPLDGRQSSLLKEFKARIETFSRLEPSRMPVVRAELAQLARSMAPGSRRF